MNNAFTKLAQFGPGFTPITPNNSYTAGSNTEAGVLANTDTILSAILGTLTILGSVFFIVYFLAAALMWLTSGTDSGKLGKARDQMIQAVIGLVVLVSSYTVIGLVGQIVGIDILNVSGLVRDLLTL